MAILAPAGLSVGITHPCSEEFSLTPHLTSSWGKILWLETVSSTGQHRFQGWLSRGPCDKGWSWKAAQCWNSLGFCRLVIGINFGHNEILTPP